MKAHVTDYVLYRWRYRIGYLLIAAIVIIILALSALYVPGALRAGEQQSALSSGALSFQSIDPNTVVNLPYHILQRLSFIAFGVTTFSIKLPSVVLGLLTSIGIFLLARSWFRRNVAVPVTILAVTTTQFLFLAQDGTPAITFSFVTIWLLTVCTYMTRKRLFSTFWKVLCGALMATALYIPLGIYIDLALFVTMTLHPHIRYILRRIPRVRFILAIILGLVSITPLVYAISLNPTIALTLLGIPTGGINVWHNLLTAGQNLFGFFSTSNNYFLRPLYSLGVVLLMLIGMYRLRTIKYTARSYTIQILASLLIVAVVFDPYNESALFPLAVLMIAMGTSTLVVYWYKLFPRNPYARIAGLLPLTVFVVGMVFSGVTRYMDNYTYNGNVLAYYNNDLRLLDRTLAANHTKYPHIRLVVTPNELAFYNLVAHYDKRFIASTSVQNNNELLIVTHDAHQTITPQTNLIDIITSRKASDADRLYIYVAK